MSEYGSVCLVLMDFIPAHQIKDRALLDLEAENQRLKAELERLQEDVGVQEEELAYQRREAEQLRQLCQQQNTVPHHQDYQIKGMCRIYLKIKD